MWRLWNPIGNSDSSFCTSPDFRNWNFKWFFHKISVLTLLMAKTKLCSQVEVHDPSFLSSLPLLWYAEQKQGCSWLLDQFMNYRTLGGGIWQRCLCKRSWGSELQEVFDWLTDTACRIPLRHALQESVSVGRWYQTEHISHKATIYHHGKLLSITPSGLWPSAGHVPTDDTPPIGTQPKNLWHL